MVDNKTIKVYFYGVFFNTNVLMLYCAREFDYNKSLFARVLTFEILIFQVYLRDPHHDLVL